jgi:hypothetical protein
MAKRETLETFLKNLPSFPVKIKVGFLDSWNLNTRQTYADSQKKIPVASKTLARSGVVRKAEITSTGIKSSIEYTVPYAKTLHDAKSDDKWKNVGQVSYYIWGKGHAGKKRGVRRGTKVNKSQKGEKGFLEKATRQNANNFVDDLGDVIDKEWFKL